MIRIGIVSLTICIGLLIAASSALAGGWAVVTLDALPTRVVAGEPLTVGFVVRQHGVRPMGGLTPLVIAVHAGTGEKVTAAASPSGEEGHYSATITFPGGGVWQWVVNDGFVTADAFGLPGGQAHAGFNGIGRSARRAPGFAKFQPDGTGGHRLADWRGGRLADVDSHAATLDGGGVAHRRDRGRGEFCPAGSGRAHRLQARRII